MKFRSMWKRRIRCSPILCIENSPSDAPSVSHDTSVGRPYSRVRQRNNGIFIFDFCEFFEDDSEVISFVTAEGTGDVFPHHISWSNIDTCPSIMLISFSHLLYNSYLFYVQPRPLTVKPSSFACDRKVLAGTAADNTIDYRGSVSAYV